MDARARTILNGTERNGTEQNKTPTLSERRFRKERKVNGTEWNQFGNFFLTRTVHMCMCTFHTPDVEVFEDLGIKVVNLSCHIQDVSNTIRTWGGKHTNAIRLLVNKYHAMH